jgi:hypothetical protein
MVPFQFELRFLQVSEALALLLDMRFVPDASSRNHPIHRSLQHILDLHTQGEFRSRDLHLNRMYLVAKNLAEVREHSPDYFESFKSRIKKAVKGDNYYGVRFELNIAATLARHNVSFEMPDPPDFLIPGFGEEVTIECTSARRRKRAPKQSYFYKIESAAGKKSRKTYTCSGTAVFVDITNLVFTTLQHNKSLLDLIDRHKLSSMCEEHEYGSLILFDYETQGSGIASVYYRIDCPAISPDLRAFLNEYFPFGHHDHSDGFLVPAEG